MAARRATTRSPRSVIRRCLVPISALLVSLTSATVGQLASAQQASAAQSHVSVVSCRNVIGSSRKPDSDLRVVLGKFAAPPKQIERAGNSAEDGWKYFAKWGVEVKAAAGPVTVSVASAYRRRAAISWGNGLGIVQAQKFASCRSKATRWDVYAGGFYMRSPAQCVPLVVRAGSRSETVRVGVGKRCAR